MYIQILVYLVDKYWKYPHLHVHVHTLYIISETTKQKYTEITWNEIIVLGIPNWTNFQDR